MADETQGTEISPTDIQGVAEKLEGFIAELPDQERNVLGWILTRAQAAGEIDDASGYSFGIVQAPSSLGTFRTPIAAQLGRSAGLGAASGTTKVVWEFSFGREAFGGRAINPI
jgi:hypothetical protein